jgi:signal transduction histidine kinase
MNEEIRKLQARLQNYHTIDQAILDNQPIEKIAELATEDVSAQISSYSRISIAILDDAGETATILAVKSSGNKIKLKAGQSIPSRAFGGLDTLKRGRIHQVEDLASQGLDNPVRDSLLAEGIHSYIIIPLITKGELIGMLNVGKKETKRFEKNEIELLEKMGTHLSLSISQARLKEQDEQQKQELSTLLKISNLLSTTIDLQQILQLTIDESTRVMGLETGAIYLLQEEEIHLGATTPPLPPDFPEKFRIAQLEHHPHIGKTIAKGQPLFLADTQTAELTPEEEEVSIARGLRSLLYVPLLSGSRAIGVLIMGTTEQTKMFSGKEIDLCSTFSAQMALAVENASLFHKTQTIASNLERRVNERTSELEALTQAISHDLRSPLRAIRGFGQILLDDHSTSLNGEGKEYLTNMVVASEKLEGMFDRLLSLTEIGKRRLLLQNLELSEIAEEILEGQIRSAPNRKIEYTIQPCEPFCKFLFADKGYVEILLTNLISNAIKFTRSRKPAKIEFGCYPKDGKGVYFLKDNGIGFDMAYEKQVFTPFQRLHSEDDIPGYGIGMTIAKKIVDLHNGQIWLESEKDKGTTVHFILEDLSQNGGASQTELP